MLLHVLAKVLANPHELFYFSRDRSARICRDRAIRLDSEVYDTTAIIFASRECVMIGGHEKRGIGQEMTYLRATPPA